MCRKIILVVALIGTTSFCDVPQKKYDELLDKYAVSLTRETRKDALIREIQKDNQNLNFWQFVWQVSTAVVATLYITK